MAALTALAPSDLPLLRDRGWFAWNIARGFAVWSDSVHLHGYEAGEVLLSSALTFHHKHPEDLYGCVDALHAGMVENRLVVHEHRLVGLYGQVRPVVMVCRSVSDSQGGGCATSAASCCRPTPGLSLPEAGLSAVVRLRSSEF